MKVVYCTSTASIAVRLAWRNLMTFDNDEIITVLHNQDLYLWNIFVKKLSKKVEKLMRYERFFAGRNSYKICKYPLKLKLEIWCAAVWKSLINIDGISIVFTKNYYHKTHKYTFLWSMTRLMESIMFFATLGCIS